MLLKNLLHLVPFAAAASALFFEPVGRLQSDSQLADALQPSAKHHVSARRTNLIEKRSSNSHVCGEWREKACYV